MKLLRLKLLQAYKSLQPFEIVFSPAFSKDRGIDPICLVGPNGSGKSNLMELLSEILCYLDLLNLPYDSISKKMTESNAMFELEYILSSDQKYKNRRVKIIKNDKKAPKYFFITDETEEDIKDPETQAMILPSKIIGYSSGLNETISYPFFRIQAVYSDEVSSSALKPAKKSKKIEDARSLYMDYDSNSAIFLANYLFQPSDKLAIFDETIRLVDAHTFRIIINLDIGRGIKTTEELDSYIQKLSDCALMPQHDRKGNKWVFDYIVNEATRTAFKEAFPSAASFFVALHKLNLLNALSIKKADREWYLKQGRNFGLLARPPMVSPKDKVFHIDEIKLRIRDPEQIIDYIGISDGEHQLLHVAGTVLLLDQPGAIFLLDEPETHLNPQWRSRLITMLNDIAKDREQEFIISSHSPFIVSDCRGSNVYVFNRSGAEIFFEPAKIETYGASFEYLLNNLFELDSDVSQLALKNMQSLIKSNDISLLRKHLSDFGNSFEKTYIYQKIAELEQKKTK
jgi:restriction system-associated AAA family ATPase